MRLAARHVIAMTFLAAVRAGAQGAPTAKLPSARICDMSMRVLIVNLVDSAGRSVGDASLSVRRLSTGRLVPRTEATGDGSYTILEDGVLRDLRPAGESFDVTFVRGTRRRRVRVRIGVDDSRCHVRFITVPSAVVL